MTRPMLITISSALILVAACGPATDSRLHGDLPELLSRTGCIDAQIEPVEQEPPIDVVAIENEVRETLLELAAEFDFGHVPGDLIWSRYGRLLEGQHFQGEVVRSDQVVWVLVFKGEAESLLDRTRLRGASPRWTALYSPDEKRVVNSCSGNAIHDD